MEQAKSALEQLLQQIQLAKMLEKRISMLQQAIDSLKEESSIPPTTMVVRGLEESIRKEIITDDGSWMWALRSEARDVSDLQSLLDLKWLEWSGKLDVLQWGEAQDMESVLRKEYRLVKSKEGGYSQMVGAVNGSGHAALKLLFEPTFTNRQLLLLILEIELFIADHKVQKDECVIIKIPETQVWLRVWSILFAIDKTKYWPMWQIWLLWIIQRAPTFLPSILTLLAPIAHTVETLQFLMQIPVQGTWFACFLKLWPNRSFVLRLLSGPIAWTLVDTPLVRAHSVLVVDRLKEALQQ